MLATNEESMPLEGGKMEPLNIAKYMQAKGDQTLAGKKLEQANIILWRKGLESSSSLHTSRKL